MNKRSRLAIIGAGGFGRQLAAVVADVNTCTSRWNFIGFVDDEANATTVEGYPIVGSIEWLCQQIEKPYVVCAIGDPRVRKKIVAECGEHGVPFATIIHPSVVMSEYVCVGEGTMIMPGTVITTNVRIGEHCLVNSGCRIGHDTTIGDYCSCMPATAIAGDVVLSEGCYLGIGSCVINKVSVGAWSVVGAGAAVVEDIPPGVVAVGVPAKPIKSTSL
jgi:sugar O-acyltransferase (sialic acid O-acetyltransferase NeuD family)